MIPAPAPFHRIRRLPPYVFAEVNEMKARARAAGRDIIDLGMGNPDAPTPPHIVDKLIETVKNPRTHRYSTSRGIPGLRRALAGYYERRFGVRLDPEREVCVTLGSKEGLANLAQAVTAPGDTILVPNPSYPIHPYGFIIAGAAIRHVHLAPGVDLMRELAHAAEHSVPPPTAMILNFPSNPTALTVDRDFYREAVAFARRRGMFILSDIAYAEIYFEAPPPSILEIPGAFEVAVEFSSLSKTYSMPGWRIGFAAGNARLIAALARIKSYLDYGAFTPIQVAATAALNGPQDCVEEARRRYRERRDLLVRGLAQAGWPVPLPPATMFCWAPLPQPFREMGSLAFAKLLLEEAEVAVSPGIGFGEYGEGFVRMALVENRHRLRQAVRNIRQFLSRHGAGARPPRERAVSGNEMGE
ncbi:MAG TPA: LL-diaminopimelate aminotransferase [Rhodospirillales bacterium]|nr:LL-diaminopimelate aminotransferase [Rhodospirillales bacterium]